MLSSSTREPTEQEIQGLGKELRSAAKHPLRRVFQSNTLDSDKLSYHNLALITCALQSDKWSEDPAAAVSRLFEDSLAQLSEAEQVVDKSNTLTWQELGLWLCGFKTINQHKSNGELYDYDTLYGIVLEKLFIGSDSTLTRRIASLFEMLARDLLKRYFGTLPMITAPQPAPYQDPTYIPRLDLYAHLDAAIKTHRVIGLVGEGGTGKSTLAKYYVQQLPGGHAHIFADFRSEDHLASSLHKSFTRLGISTAGLSRDTAFYRLLDVLSDQEQCPAFVILDNVSEAKQLEFIGDLPAWATFFITTRDNRVVPKTAVRVVVNEFSKEQATAAILLKLPDATKTELKTLKLLHGRALAIDIACAYMDYIKDSPDKRRDFTAALARFTGRRLNFAAAERAKQTLEAMYAEIIRQLESDKYTAPAVRLLSIEVAFNLMRPFYSFMYIPKAEGSSLERAVHMVSSQPAPHKTRLFIRQQLGVEQIDHEIFSRGYPEYESALEILKGFHIVRSGGGPSSDIIEDTDMHPLTVEVLYGNFESSLGDQCQNLMGEYVYIVSNLLDRAREIIAVGKEVEQPSDVGFVWREIGMGAIVFERLGKAGKRVSNDEFFTNALGYSKVLRKTARYLMRHFDVERREDIDPTMPRRPR